MRYFRSQGIGHGITSRIIEKDFSPFKKRPPRGCAIRGAWGGWRRDLTLQWLRWPISCRQSVLAWLPGL